MGRLLLKCDSCQQHYAVDRIQMQKEETNTKETVEGDLENHEHTKQKSRKQDKQTN